MTKARSLPSSLAGRWMRHSRLFRVQALQRYLHLLAPERAASLTKTALRCEQNAGNVVCLGRSLWQWVGR